MDGTVAGRPRGRWHDRGGMADADRPSTTDAPPHAGVLGDTRPLTARSVVASALLGSKPPQLPVRSLVQAGSLFGIGEGAIRTALWRMVGAGELTAEDGWYRLAGRLLDRQERVDESTVPHRRPWDGTWVLAVVAVDRRPPGERLELRSAAAALHLAPLREGVWVRPDNLDPGRLPHQRAVIEAQCLTFRGAAAPEGVAARVFDLTGWAARATDLMRAVDRAADRLDAPATADLAECFLLSIAVVRHLGADPLLPDELLPTAWPGDDLRKAYAGYDAAYQRALAGALRHDARVSDPTG